MFCSSLIRIHLYNQVFHEGLKSWSCCQDIYKPVLDFDEFMTIPESFAYIFRSSIQMLIIWFIQPCTEIKGHSSAAIRDTPKAFANAAQSIPRNLPTETSVGGQPGQEVFQVGAPRESIPSGSVNRPTTPAPVLEEDDLTSQVPAGTICRRKGCGVIFISDEVNRQGDGEGAICHYHPLPVRTWMIPFSS
jgi:hypothetical protein